jgi:hypothetical protein
MLRWLVCCAIGGCCCGMPEPVAPTPGAREFDLRCAEDCGSLGSVFENVTYEVAVTGEDSWRCYCRRGPDAVEQIW